MRLCNSSLVERMIGEQDNSIISAEDVSRIHGIPLDQQVNALVISVGDKKKNNPHKLAIIPANMRLSYPMLRDKLGVKRVAIVADPSEHGYNPGESPPFPDGWNGIAGVIFYQRIKDHEFVYAGSGVRGVIAEVRPQRIIDAWQKNNYPLIEVNE